MTRDTPEAHLIVFIASTLGCLCLIFFIVPICISKGVRARASIRWPVIDAKVEQARVKRQSGKSGTSYSHEIEYSYSAAGASQYGNQISFNSFGQMPRWNSESLAARALPRIGDMLKVRVNPDNPTESVIYTADSMGADYLPAIAAGIVGISFGGIAVVCALRMSATKR